MELSINGECILCKQDSKSNTCLFFKCSCSNRLWEKFKNKQQLPGGITNNIHDIFDAIFNGNNGNRPTNKLNDIVVTTLIWHIWKECNIRIFQSTETPAYIRSKQMMTDCKQLITNKRIKANKIRGFKHIF